MKKKYLQPSQLILECYPMQPLFAISGTTQQVNVYSDELVAPEDAMVKDIPFDFSWN